jgi:hypothetical protein
MIANTIGQIAIFAFLLGIVFTTYYWFKAFEYRNFRSNSIFFDMNFCYIAIFFSKFFTKEGKRYRTKYLYALCTTLFMLSIPFMLRHLAGP